MSFQKSFAGLAATVGLLSVALIPAFAQAPLTQGKPIVIPGGPGAFDWMYVDGRTDRVFATHKGTKSVAIVDLKAEKALPSVTVGTAQGVAIDRRDNKIFLGDADEKKVVVVDNTTMQKTGEIAVTGPVDDVLYCAKNGMIYACEDDGENVWVIDPKTEKIVATVKIPSGPEKIAYDRTSDRIYLNIKTNDTIQVIDPATNKVEKTLPTAPATGPHGIAIDGKGQRIFSAGKNGKLVVLDIKTGKVVTTVDIKPGVDQIAFDAGNQRLYCGCKGFISVVQVTEDGAKLLADVPAPKGAHTLAVDAKTHAVWTCYADDKESYLVKFTP